MWGKDIVNVSREGVRTPFLLTVLAGEVESMCLYWEQHFTYSGCTSEDSHVHKTTTWNECEPAKATGRRCEGEGAQPMKGKNGEIIQTASTRIKGECPLCPP